MLVCISLHVPNAYICGAHETKKLRNYPTPHIYTHLCLCAQAPHVHGDCTWSFRAQSSHLHRFQKINKPKNVAPGK